MDFISLGRVENHCGSNSDMNVLVTTLHCVGSLDIKRFNAPNLLTELHQTNIVFHCRPSSCMGCVKSYHPLGMIHSEAQSSPAHGAKSALQLVPCQHFSHPGIHVAPSQGSQAMQLASTIGIQSHTLLSPSALHFHDDTYVASPQSIQLLPIEFYTQVGGYPLASSGHTTPSPGSLAATSQLGASR
jgi:hypothetical protein